MPRFVILEHDHPHLHWDLMLEDGESLRTWRLNELPRSGVWIEAEEIAPHRLAYLDYEGEVSGGRGTVKRWEWGTFIPTSWSRPPLVLDLEGHHYRGTIMLVLHAESWRCRWRFEEIPSTSA